MQINIAIDEELHGRLLKESKLAKLPLPDLARSALRSIAPESEKLKVQRIEYLENKLIGKSINVTGQIAEFRALKGEFWCASFVLSSEDINEIIHNNSKDYIFAIVTENNRQGVGKVIRFSGARDGMEFFISGITALS